MKPPVYYGLLIKVCLHGHAEVSRLRPITWHLCMMHESVCRATTAHSTKPLVDIVTCLFTTIHTLTHTTWRCRVTHTLAWTMSTDLSPQTHTHRAVVVEHIRNTIHSDAFAWVLFNHHPSCRSQNTTSSKFDGWGGVWFWAAPFFPCRFLFPSLCCSLTFVSLVENFTGHLLSYLLFSRL